MLDSEVLTDNAPMFKVFVCLGSPMRQTRDKNRRYDGLITLAKPRFK